MSAEVKFEGKTGNEFLVFLKRLPQPTFSICEGRKFQQYRLSDLEAMAAQGAKTDNDFVSDEVIDQLKTMNQAGNALIEQYSAFIRCIVKVIYAVLRWFANGCKSINHIENIENLKNLRKKGESSATADRIVTPPSQITPAADIKVVDVASSSLTSGSTETPKLPSVTKPVPTSTASQGSSTTSSAPSAPVEAPPKESFLDLAKKGEFSIAQTQELLAQETLDMTDWPVFKECKFYARDWFKDEQDHDAPASCRWFLNEVLENCTKLKKVVVRSVSLEALGTWSRIALAKQFKHIEFELPPLELRYMEREPKRDGDLSVKEYLERYGNTPEKRRAICELNFPLAITKITIGLNLDCFLSEMCKAHSAETVTLVAAHMEHCCEKGRLSYSFPDLFKNMSPENKLALGALILQRPDAKEYFLLFIQATAEESFSFQATLAKACSQFAGDAQFQIDLLNALVSAYKPNLADIRYVIQQMNETSFAQFLGKYFGDKPIEPTGQFQEPLLFRLLRLLPYSQTGAVLSYLETSRPDQFKDAKESIVLHPTCQRSILDTTFSKAVVHMAVFSTLEILRNPKHTPEQAAELVKQIYRKFGCNEEQNEFGRLLGTECNVDDVEKIMKAYDHIHCATVQRSVYYFLESIIKRADWLLTERAFVHLWSLRNALQTHTAYNTITDLLRRIPDTQTLWKVVDALEIIAASVKEADKKRLTEWLDAQLMEQRESIEMSSGHHRPVIKRPQVNDKQVEYILKGHPAVIQHLSEHLLRGLHIRLYPPQPEEPTATPVKKGWGSAGKRAKVEREAYDKWKQELETDIERLIKQGIFDLDNSLRPVKTLIFEYLSTSLGKQAIDIVYPPKT